MGCRNSKRVENDTHEPSSSIVNKKIMASETEINSMKDFKVNTGGLVSKKYGNITKEYKISKVMGSGAFGEVAKATHKASGQLRAIKKLIKAAMTTSEINALNNEIIILKTLDHPSIMKTYEFYEDEHFFYIVTELCTGGELFDKIVKKGSFNEQNAANYMSQILSAVSYCHSYKIVHRDLKPENILFETDKEDSPLKVIDFGTSGFFNPQRKLNQKTGTPFYIAPEVLKRSYDEKCDVWSCGVIMYILLCGSPPFNGDDNDSILKAVSLGVFDFNGEEWIHVSDSAKDMISKMLTFKSENRPSAQDCLEHSWISSNFKKEVVNQPLLQTALSKMKNFNSDRKLQEAFWNFLVTRVATKEEKNHMMNAFKAIDKNNDGQLSKEELLEEYTKLYGETRAIEEVNMIMERLDQNNSGTIDYTEFAIATLDKQSLLKKKRLEKAFKLFDTV